MELAADVLIFLQDSWLYKNLMAPCSVPAAVGVLIDVHELMV